MHRTPSMGLAGAVGGLVLAGCSIVGEPAPPSPGAADQERLIARGEELYAANCQACHGDRAGEGGAPGAPPHNQDGHTWHHPDAQLEEWILHGKPPGAMPAFEDQLNREDVQAVLAFIKTWWTAEQREMQADVSRRYQEGLDRQKQGR